MYGYLQIFIEALLKSAPKFNTEIIELDTIVEYRSDRNRTSVFNCFSFVYITARSASYLILLMRCIIAGHTFHNEVISDYCRSVFLSVSVCQEPLR